MGPSIEIEVLLLSERDGCLNYRAVREILPAFVHPDDAARQLAGLTTCTSGGLLHSTSWRPVSGGIVLTYAAVPDLHPERGATPVQVDAMACAGHPLAPSPEHVELDAVAAHACRHLALLQQTDEQVMCAATQRRAFWQLIAKLRPGTAGALTPVRLGG